MILIKLNLLCNIFNKIYDASAKNEILQIFQLKQRASLRRTAENDSLCTCIPKKNLLFSANQKKKLLFNLSSYIFILHFLFCSTGKSNVLVKDGKRKRLIINNLDSPENKDIKHIVSGISNSLTNGLSRVENLEVVGPAEKANGLKVVREKLMIGENIDPAEILSKITSADYACNGEVQTEGVRAQVNVRISDSKSGTVVLSSSSKGTIDKPITLQENLLNNILSNLDVNKPNSQADKSLIITTSSELAFLKYSQASEFLYTNPKKAGIYLIEALREDPEYLDALEDLSFVLYQMGDLNSSKKFLLLKKELLIKKLQNKTEDYGNTLCNIGVIEFELGFQKEGENYCNEDKILKEKIGRVDTKAYANTLQILGSFSISKNEFSSGISYLSKSKDIYKKIGLEESLDYAELLINLGVAFYRNNDLISAGEIFYLSEQIYKKLDITNTSSYASLLSNQSMVHLKKQEYKEAVKKLIQDKEIQEKLGLTKSKNFITTLNNLSYVMNELGLKDRAAFFAKESKKIKDTLIK